MAEIKENLQLISKSVELIKNIDSDFEEYKKTGRCVLNNSTVNIGRLLEEVAKDEGIQRLAKKHGVSLVLKTRAARAYTDVLKLKQVLINLVTNAIKYNKDDGKGSVTLECYGAGPSAEIIVSDNGIGLSKEELAVLGRPFFRSKRVEREGTGLGLCTVFKLATICGWDIKVESVISKGTKVKLVLHHITG